MEENTNTTEQATQAVDMGKETTEQGATDKGQKTFTQDEVNSIVQSRLNREKSQVSKEAQAEYEQKLADLNTREMKLLLKEQLDSRSMSRKLADIITCTDEEDLKQKLDILEEVCGSQKSKEQTTGFIQIGSPSVSGYNYHDNQAADPVRDAFGL